MAENNQPGPTGVTADVLDAQSRPWPWRIPFGTPAQWQQWSRLYDLIVELGNGHGDLTIHFAAGRPVNVSLHLNPRCVEE